MQFFIYAYAKRGSMARAILPTKRWKAIPKSVGSSSLQDGSCLTPATILPKAPPLDSKRTFGAALLTLSKRQERHDGKTEGENQISEKADTQT